MTDDQIDLSGELSRAEEAAAGGIEVRAILFEMDDDDEQLTADGGVSHWSTATGLTTLTGPQLLLEALAGSVVNSGSRAREHPRPESAEAPAGNCVAPESAAFLH